MKTVTRTYNVYKFDELSQLAKNNAIAKEVEFIINDYDGDKAVYSDNFAKAFEKAYAMRTPWFIGDYILDYCKDEIIARLQDPDYDFNADGTFFNL